jgi:hypothetical protein
MQHSLSHLSLTGLLFTRRQNSHSLLECALFDTSNNHPIGQCVSVDFVFDDYCVGDVADDKDDDDAMCTRRISRGWCADAGNDALPILCEWPLRFFSFTEHFVVL